MRSGHSASVLSSPRLEDFRWSGTAQTAGRIERIHTKKLMDQAASDAKHGGAAILALNVELEGLGGWIVITHPRFPTNITRCRIGGAVTLVLEEEEAGLHHAGGQHNLQPGCCRESLERPKAA